MSALATCGPSVLSPCSGCMVRSTSHRRSFLHEVLCVFLATGLDLPRSQGRNEPGTGLSPRPPGPARPDEVAFGVVLIEFLAVLLIHLAAPRQPDRDVLSDANGAGVGPLCSISLVH